MVFQFKIGGSFTDEKWANLLHITLSEVLKLKIVFLDLAIDLLN